MKEEDLFDEMALEFAKVMTRFFHVYPKKENHMAAILADSLGGLLAIAANEPEVAIERICTRLKNFPWQQVRAAHYTAVQGITDEVGNLRSFGPARGKPR